MPTFPVYNKPRYLKEPLAPSGTIVITKYIPPFIKGKDGFGYQGVVSTDKKTGEIQCHTCGKFFGQLGYHCSRKHKLYGDAYRDRYGLTRNIALKSMDIRLVHSKNMSKLKKKGIMNTGNSFNTSTGKAYGFTPKNKYAGNKKGRKNPLEIANKYGRCDDQIKDAILKLAKKINKTPTLTQIFDEYGGGLISTMHARYGSYIKYCRKVLNLEPVFSTHNPQFKNNKEKLEHYIKIGKQAIKNGGKPSNIKKLLGPTPSTAVSRLLSGKGGWKKYRQLITN